MRNAQIATMVLAAFLCSSTASAADKDGNFSGLGIGNSSCGKLLASLESRSASRETEWVNGYLSAYNKLVPNGLADITGDIDSASTMVWIKNYCTTNPMSHLSGATIAFTVALAQKRK